MSNAFCILSKFMFVLYTICSPLCVISIFSGSKPVSYKLLLINEQFVLEANVCPRGFVHFYGWKRLYGRTVSHVCERYERKKKSKNLQIVQQISIQSLMYLLVVKLDKLLFAPD